MSKMVGLAGASSPLLFARSSSGNPPQGLDPNTRFPLLASCSLKTPNLVALDNSMEQDPCQIVWALLPGPCLDQEEVTPGTLPPWNHLYNNTCFCNTVFYSLVSACVLCTNAQSTIFSWSQYTGLLKCQPADVTTYSQPIPPDTSIPSWANQQVIGGTFNVQIAEKAAKQAQSNVNPAPNSTTPSPSPSSPTNTPAASTASNTAPVTTGGTSSGSLTTSTPSGLESTASIVSTTSSTSPSRTATTTGSGSSQPNSTLREGLTSSTQTTVSPDYTHTSIASNGTGVASNEQPTGTSTSGSAGATDLHSKRKSAIGAILGGVFGGIAAVILVVCIFLCLARRRRRRREKEAMLASGPLDWWRQTDILPRLMKREPSESSTIKADDLDYDDDMETLHAMSVEKKSVTYGEYPDL